jgi:hypothetical protein
MSYRAITPFAVALMLGSILSDQASARVARGFGWGWGGAWARADNPPGSLFQTQGIREWNGVRAVPSVWSRIAHRRGYRRYAYYD